MSKQTKMRTLTPSNELFTQAGLDYLRDVLSPTNLPVDACHNEFVNEVFKRQLWEKIIEKVKRGTFSG